MREGGCPNPEKKSYHADALCALLPMICDDDDPAHKMTPPPALRAQHPTRIFFNFSAIF